MWGRGWPTLVLAVLCVAAVELALPRHLINHDVAQFMYGGRAALNGTRLYSGFVEMNLPTVYYASALPMLVADALGLSPAGGLMLTVMALVALSVAACARMLERAGLGGQGAFLLVVLVAEVLPACRHFGQREHVAAILTLPYVLSFLGPPVGRRAVAENVAVGVLAGFGLCLKPYFFALPLFVEAAVFCRRRWWGHGQSWSAVAVGGALLAVALWRQPDYLTVMVPLARAAYGGWDMPLPLLFVTEGAISSALTLWLAVRIPATPAHRQPRLLLAAAVAAGLVAALTQRKGYDYHFLPALVPAVPLLALVIVDGLAAWHADDPAARKHARFGLALAALVALWDGNRALRDALWPFDYNDTADRMAPVVARYGGGRPIAGLSVHVFPTFPYLLRHGGAWALRTPSLWPLVGHMDESGADVQAVRRMVVEDLAAQAPCLVFVDTWRWGNVTYPFIDFLSGESGFAEIWRRYRLVEQIDGYDFYSRCDPPRTIP